MKKCTRCNELKPLNEFHKQSTAKDGLQHWCKRCMSKYTLAKFMKKYRIIDGIKERQCTNCKQWKLIDRFSKHPASRDGLNPRCRECITKQGKKYSETHKTKIAEYQETHRAENNKRIREYRRTFIGCLRNRRGHMLQRCANPNNPRYNRYGERGIKCLFESAEALADHIIDLGYSTYEQIKNLIIHRPDDDGHYEVGNIQLLTKPEHSTFHAAMRKKNECCCQ